MAIVAIVVLVVVVAVAVAVVAVAEDISSILMCHAVVSFFRCFSSFKLISF